MSLPTFETTAVAFTANGQFSIIPNGEVVNDGKALGGAWFVTCVFFAQQSCDRIDAHELATITVSELAVVMSAGRAMAVLLQLNIQAAPAIQRDTLIATTNRNGLLLKNRFIQTQFTLLNSEVSRPLKAGVADNPSKSLEIAIFSQHF